jgi:hypothetical protein
MPRPPDYGIIYNWDGLPHGLSAFPQTTEDFLDKVYGIVEDTQVGAHFWCVGEHQSRWKSDNLELVGDIHGRRYENILMYHYHENIRAMIERGDDPQEAVIKRGRDLGMAVYGSIRMNDNHFFGAQIKDLPTLHSSELTRIRVEHPEWVLGEKTSEWFALSWNFEIPEVREHRFTHVRECCERYDWDGVELDWQRHPFHLPDDHGYRLRYVITDLQRAVRQVTNGLAEKRGRPFYVATRVAPTVETSKRLGYDVEQWVKEGLVDIMIPAGAAHTDPDVDLSAYLDLCKGTDVVVYPGFDARIDGFDFWGFPGPEPLQTKEDMRTRAVANHYHNHGADGIYVFNWYGGRDSRRHLLNQIGAPETLRGTDKIYAPSHRYRVQEGEWRGAFQYDREWGPVPVALKPTITGDGPTITIDVADDLGSEPTKDVVLRIRLDNWVNGDVVKVLWDDQEQADMEQTYDFQEIEAGNPFGYKTFDVAQASWLSRRLSPKSVLKGKHQVKVVLKKRHPMIACELNLTHVELAIRYSN